MSDAPKVETKKEPGPSKLAALKAKLGPFIKKSGKWFGLLGLIGALGGVIHLGIKKHWLDHVPNPFAGLIHSVHQVQEKVQAIQDHDLVNRRLDLENQNLRRWVEDLKYDCTIRSVQEDHEGTKLKLSKETGTEVGRTLASIPYTPPGHLLPAQLYTLAVTYFKAREDEKAAVIFTYLTGGEDDHDPFKTPQNYLFAATSWYRLEHLKLADVFLDKILKLESNESVRSYQTQARLWKSLIYRRQRDTEKSQFWMKELLDKDPHSNEASWINPTEDNGG